ncbi:MAG: hypothetical protein ACF8R7_03875 [Phycisphaerales bacterium JB039]
MAERDDFYVGYLPAPRAHRRLLRIAIPGLLWLGAILSVIVVWQMRDPGGAVWEDARARTWEGAIRLIPYPALEVVEDGATTTYLLVEMGKFGAERAGAFENKRVRIDGYLLRRDGRRIIELDPADTAITALGDAPGAAAPRELGAVTIRGEIVDTKCFLGAMKPGDGKAHKACAELCVAGGIPPTLISIAPDGSRRYHLLIGPDGGPAGELVAGLLADPVEVRGMEMDRAGLRLLRLDGPGAIRR